MNRFLIVLAGFSVAVALTGGLWALEQTADESAAVEQATRPAAPGARAAAPEAASSHGGTPGGLTSYAGAAPANAAQLAAARKPYPSELPPVPKGDVVPVEITLKDVTVEIAPGVRYQAWGFDGGAPGPTIHVRQGQRVRITLTNGGAIPHSIDFHAARIAPNVAFRDVAPGESITYAFEARDPGVYVYHCGTKPVLAHIANGLYGAIVVDPATPLPKADREYVLLSSEWYLNGPGTSEPAQLDMAKARAMMPDWVTWNGYAGQYATHPLTAEPNELVRFYVAAAGPSLDTDFHVVGTVLDRAWVNQDMTQFQRGVQTVEVPAGGGALFDVRIPEPGLYPFVSHSFASVDLGQVGLLKVGAVYGGPGHPALQKSTAAKLRVGVVLKEWALIPSVRSVKAGRVTFVASNKGRIEHELVVVRTNLRHSRLPMHVRMAAHAAAHVHVAPGSTSRLTLTLRPGRYVLICNLPGHYEAGQYAGLVVR